MLNGQGEAVFKIGQMGTLAPGRACPWGSLWHLGFWARPQMGSRGLCSSPLVPGPRCVPSQSWITRMVLSTGCLGLSPTPAFSSEAGVSPRRAGWGEQAPGTLFLVRLL